MSKTKFVLAMLGTRVRRARAVLKAICMMASFDYNYQNPSPFLFLILSSYLNPTGASKFTNEHDKEQSTGVYSIWSNKKTTNRRKSFAYCHE